MTMIGNETLIPAPILRALEHVRASHPEVVRVVFQQESPECGGFWRYETISGDAPSFGPWVDVALLEAALDSAWCHCAFPAIYELRGV